MNTRLSARFLFLDSELRSILRKFEVSEFKSLQRVLAKADIEEDLYRGRLLQLQVGPQLGVASAQSKWSTSSDMHRLDSIKRLPEVALTLLLVDIPNFALD